MFDPNEFYQFAQKWAVNANNETVIRVCIGRAYYAAHLIAREKVRPHYAGFEPYGGCQDEHSKVEDLLSDLDHKDIANQLHNLHDLRKRADYQIQNYPQADWTSEIRFTFALCDSILSDLQQVH